MGVDLGEEGVAGLSQPIFSLISNNPAVLTARNINSKISAELTGLCVFCNKSDIMIKSERAGYGGYWT